MTGPFCPLPLSHRSLGCLPQLLWSKLFPPRFTHFPFSPQSLSKMSEEKLSSKYL